MAAVPPCCASNSCAEAAGRVMPQQDTAARARRASRGFCKRCPWSGIVSTAAPARSGMRCDLTSFLPALGRRARASPAAPLRSTTRKHAVTTGHQIASGSYSLQPPWATTPMPQSKAGKTERGCSHSRPEEKGSAQALPNQAEPANTPNTQRPSSSTGPLPFSQAFYAIMRRRSTPTAPTSPVPSRTRLPGSGVAETLTLKGAYSLPTLKSLVW